MTTETVDSEEPKFVRKRAIDVTPYMHALWCSIENSAPFASPIESRSWSEDGAKIWFMLGTHNFYSAAPDEEIQVVEVKCSTSPDFCDFLARDAKRMADRPIPQPKCPTCGHQPPPKRANPDPGPFG